MPVWVFSGVAGSGKSTLAQAVGLALAWEVLDADDFHPEANRAKMRSGQALDEADREPWLAALSAALVERQARDTVLAFPGLKAAHRQRLENAVGPGRLHWALLEVSQATVEMRLARRGGFFPPELAASQFRDWERDASVKRLDGESTVEEILAEALDWIRQNA